MPSNLCGAAVNEQLDPGDEAGILRGQEERRSRDFMGLADPPHRNQRHELIFDVLSHAHEHTGVNSAGAEDIHANLPRLQINRPSASERTYSGLTRIVDAEAPKPLHAG